jgi:putative DNA primase/helicase
VQSAVAVNADQLDTKHDLLNVLNGTIHLPTGESRPHNRTDLITQLISITYDPNARAPRWKQFLREIFSSDELDKEASRQRAEILSEYSRVRVGYSLTGKQREQDFCFCYGEGQNGKSLFREVILKMMGDYGQVAPTSLFLKDKGSRIPSDEARLRGKRFVVCSETDANRQLDEEKLKRLTGDERIVACFKYRDEFEFEPTYHLWLFSNHKPEIRGQERAIWRRLKLIPFEVTFEEVDKKPETNHPKNIVLKDALEAELPGIMAWAVSGAKQWYAVGLKEPAVISEAVNAYKNDEDIIGEFIEECVAPENETPSGAYVTKTELFAAYRVWARLHNYSVWSQKNLGARLLTRGWKEHRNNHGRIWLERRPMDEWEILAKEEIERQKHPGARPMGKRD